MEEASIIKKLIEREERYMTDAAERQDAEDTYFYKTRKRAFEEIKPLYHELLDENQALQEQVKRYKWEDEQFTWLEEQVKVSCDEYRKQAKEIERLRKENERFRKSLGQISGATMSQYADFGHMACSLKSVARNALYPSS